MTGEIFMYHNICKGELEYILNQSNEWEKISVFEPTNGKIK